jgi:Yip1 domain
MNCPKCKAPASINARFCGVCGQPLTAPTSIRAPASPLTAGSAAAAATNASGSWSISVVLMRIKNILLTPKSEWPVIAAEPASAAKLYLGYVVPLTAWAALMSLLRLTLIGARVPFGGMQRIPLTGSLGLAAWSLVWTFVGSFIGLFLVGLIVNALAPTFGGSRDQTQALKVAAYSLTAAYVGTALALSPVLPGLLQFVVLCYGIYVLYLGLPVVMRSPPERALGYTATVIICTLLLGLVLMLAAGALGIFTHSDGLMGRNAAQQADAQDQAAATVGNAIGNALGTDDKGKAGIASALSNLAKAGEQNAGSNASNAATSAPTSGAGAQSPGADAANSSPADSAQNAGAAVGGLLGALGGALGGDHPKAAVDFKSLTPLLPASLPGMKRVAASGEAQGAIGIKTTSANGTYQGGNGTVKVEISDMSALSGLMGMAGALVESTTSESDSGFERNKSIGGYSAHEKYDAPNKHAELSITVAKRYQVDLTGDGVDMSTLENDVGQIDLSRLEAMKDQGSPPR